MICEITTITGERIMVDEFLRIARTFGLKDLGPLEQQLSTGAVCEVQGYLWLDRNRKKGYPMDDPITMMIRIAGTDRTAATGEIPKTIASWY